jgi:hypothetical protein
MLSRNFLYSEVGALIVIPANAGIEVFLFFRRFRSGMAVSW